MCVTRIIHWSCMVCEVPAWSRARVKGSDRSSAPNRARRSRRYIPVDTCRERREGESFLISIISGDPEYQLRAIYRTGADLPSQKPIPLSLNLHSHKSTAVSTTRSSNSCQILSCIQCLHQAWSHHAAQHHFLALTLSDSKRRFSSAMSSSNTCSLDS